jgi:hypothetical protein
MTTHLKITDSVFLSLVNNNKIVTLIPDLSSNEGGSTDSRNSLLKYILPNKFEVKQYEVRLFYSFLEVPK